jgi:Cyclin, N-terminal domain
MKNFHQNKKVLRTLEQTVIFDVFCPTSTILDSESIKEVDY